MIEMLKICEVEEFKQYYLKNVMDSKTVRNDVDGILNNDIDSLLI